MSINTNEYQYGYSREELQRLGEQHQVWAQDNRRFLDRAGFKPGAFIVDLGCGPGFTTLDLARLVGPKGHVIAVDRDGERSLPLLRERAAAAGLTNIETRAAELDAFDLPAGCVDGVYARWVLMYLPEPEAMALVSRMTKWLQRGGACALAELCNFRHIHVHPPCENLPAVAEGLIKAVTGGRGCNPEIGNALPGLLAAAGLEVDFRVNVKAVRATTPGWRWPAGLFETHLDGLVEKGFLSAEAREAFSMEWEERSRNPNAIFFGSPLMEAVGRRT